MTIEPNVLIHADALLVLERMKSATVDLVYLDPPWLVKPNLTDIEKNTYNTFIYKVIQQAKRVLKPTGNLFLYSRPDVTLDLNPLLTNVFGIANFVAEFVIPRSNYGHISLNVWPSHETILFYKCSEQQVQNSVYRTRDIDVSKLFPYQDEQGRYRHQTIFVADAVPGFDFRWKEISPPTGRRWALSLNGLEELWAQKLIAISKGQPFLKKYQTEESLLIPVGTIWDDLSSLTEKRDLPAQQPLSLLERVIRIGTNSGQTVCDPFCGSGTTIMAAVALGRKFVACDNEPLAIEICSKRLQGSNKTADYTAVSEQAILQLPVIWNSYKANSSQEEEEAFRVILNGETTFVEFKESVCWHYRNGQKDPSLIENLYKTIAAFMNSFGGKLFIGVRKDGSLQDLQLDYAAADPGKKDRDGYALFLSHKITSKLGPAALHNYHIQFFKFDECDICQIIVEPSKELVFWLEQFYVRINNESVPLNNEQFYGYLKNRGSVV